MPFFKTIKNTDGQIGLWKFTENINELHLQANLTKKETTQLQNIHAERRQKEFLAVRTLLKKMLDNTISIRYADNGKPILEESPLNISISHSADFACIFLSTKNIGIDVEQINRKTDKIAPRFLHPREIDFIEKLKNRQLARIVFWSAKEAIYKCAGLENIQFNKMILIHPFDIEKKQEFTAQLNFERKILNFRLNFTQIKNNVLVYAVHDKKNKNETVHG